MELVRALVHRWHRASRPLNQHITLLRWPGRRMRQMLRQEPLQPLTRLVVLLETLRHRTRHVRDQTLSVKQQEIDSTPESDSLPTSSTQEPFRTQPSSILDAEPLKWEPQDRSKLEPTSRLTSQRNRARRLESISKTSVTISTRSWVDQWAEEESNGYP